MPTPHPAPLDSVRATPGALEWCWLAGLGVVLAGPAAVMAQTAEAGPGIYVCVDAQGRRLTSDRPIPECLGREQRVLSPTGATRRIIPPSLTAEEREQLQAQEQQAAAQRAKAQEQARRDRVLLSRYPNPSKHDEERGKQLAHIDSVVATLHQRSRELVRQRAELDQEMEFYRANPAKAPAWLKRRLNDNTEQQAAQQRLLDAQATEKERIHQRFDEELTRLQPLWSARPTATPR